MSASATIVSFLLIESCRLPGTVSKRHNTINYRSFKDFNPDHFCSELRTGITSQNWDVWDNFKDPNDMWREWKIKFLNVVNTHAPLRTKRVRSKRSPWITSDLKAMRSKNPQDWGEFKWLRIKVNSNIKIAKGSYYNHLLNTKWLSPHLVNYKRTYISLK